MAGGIYQLHQGLRVGIGQRLEEYSINHREDRGIHADADGDDEQGDRCESGCLGKRTQREAQVAPYIFNQGEGPIAPYALPRCAGIAKAQTSLAARFLRRQTARGIRVLLMGQMGLDLLRQILIFPYCDA